MIYLDASAMVTLVVRRVHAEALHDFVGMQPTCSSTIGFVETVRACDRIGEYPGLLPKLLHDHAEVPLTPLVRDAAVNVHSTLRTLDALHVASAELLGSELTALVTYDRRMADAARANGLPVAAPGLSLQR